VGHPPRAAIRAVPAQDLPARPTRRPAPAGPRPPASQPARAVASAGVV